MGKPQPEPVRVLNDAVALHRYSRRPRQVVGDAAGALVLRVCGLLEGD